jgi:hypothetical protein
MSFASTWISKSKSETPDHIDNIDNNQCKGIFVDIVDTKTVHFSGKSVSPTQNGVSESKTPNPIDNIDNNRKQGIFVDIVDTTPVSGKQIGTPAREFLDLAGRGIVTLQTDGRGGLWWAAPRYEDDPASLANIADLWTEAWSDLFRLLGAGGLDRLLHRRTTSTPAQPMERPRRRRITPAMLERYHRARPWIEAHMPALLAQGWTRRTLHRAGRRPYPFGPWGLAWATAWTAPQLERVEIGPDGVAFVLNEPHRASIQTARPKP